MIKGNSKFLMFMRLFALGFMGGTIYLLMFVRYCFYDQMMEALQCTNAQLGFLNTICAIIATPLGLVGAYLADKYDAKKIILLSVGGITVITFVYGFFANSYFASIVAFIAQPVALMSYWACLIKVYQQFRR